MGISIDENKGKIYCNTKQINNTIIHLDFPSVGATENIILASVLSNAEVTIGNAAMEPEITDLCLFLTKMGAAIEGIGTNSLKIIGVKRLKSVSIIKFFAEIITK